MAPLRAGQKRPHGGQADGTAQQRRQPLSRMAATGHTKTGRRLRRTKAGRGLTRIPPLPGGADPGRTARCAGLTTLGAATSGLPRRPARMPGDPPGSATHGVRGRPPTHLRGCGLDPRMPGKPGKSPQEQERGLPRMEGVRRPHGAQKRRAGPGRERRAPRPGGMEAHHLSHTQDASRRVRAWSTASLFNSCSESPRGGQRPGHAGRQADLRHGGVAPCSIRSWRTMTQRPSWRSTAWNDYYESGEPARMPDSLGIGKGRCRTQPVRGEGRGAAVMSMMNVGPGVNPPPAGGDETYGGLAS